MAARASKRGAKAAENPDDEDDSPATAALSDIEDDAEESMALDLQAALAEFGGDSGQISVQLIKTAPKDEAGACTTYSSGDLSVDRVRDDWGAGTYKVFFRNAQGRIVTRKTLSIVQKKVQSQAATTTDLAKLLEQQKAGEGGNTTLLMMKMIEMQSAQMVALLARPVPAAPITPPMGAAEIIAMMTGLASIMKPATPAESPMDAMLKGVKLANELRGDGDGDGGIVGMISKGLDVIPGLMQGAPALPAPASTTPRVVEVRQVQTPQAVATPEVVPTYQGKDAAENDMLARLVWLRGRVGYLLEKARANKDPALYADLFLDELPDFVTLEDIRQQMEKSDWYTQLCSINRECERFEEWFEAFRDTIVETFREAAAQLAETEAALAPNRGNGERTSTDDETTPLN